MLGAKRITLTIICLFAIAHVPALHADVKFHGLFTDNMVLQQGLAVPVWGTADEGESVTVAFCDQTKSATAKDGKWMVKLGSPRAGGPHTMTVSGKNKIELKNVLVGEVWVCSGQSNMNWRVSGCVNAQEEIASSTNDMIRSYTVRQRAATEPESDVSASWQLCNPQTVGSFTAVGYFFARDVQKARNVPVGIIHTSWGGTPAESWTRLEVLKADPELKPIVDRFQTIIDRHPQAVEQHKKRVEQWKAATAKAAQEGKPFPRRMPRPPRGPNSPHRPSGLYNGMIAPLIPYAIAGAIWYQGESNAGRAFEYRTLFPAMIQCWRQDWGQGDFPFFWAQLAAFKGIWTEPKDAAWPELREAQTMTLALPNTGMAVLTDVGNESDIHPRRKQEVGARLALAARAVAYRENVVYSGPTFDSMTKQGSKIEIAFKHTGSGLVAKDDAVCAAPVSGRILRVGREKGRVTRAEAMLKQAQEALAKKPDDMRAKAVVEARTKALAKVSEQVPAALSRAEQQADAEKTARTTALGARNAADQSSKLKGFAVCGEDQKFVWANAQIVGANTVVVHSPKVTNPVAVRYAWEDYPVCNLYNKEELPAVPFRTDAFAMVTEPQAQK